jgi:hypothetical protein
VVRHQANLLWGADSFRYLALTLDRRATLSGFYRRTDYPQHGVV